VGSPVELGATEEVLMEETFSEGHWKLLKDGFGGILKIGLK
jgi:hypothetical protein